MSPPNPLDLDRIVVEAPEPRLPWPAALRLIFLLSAFLWLLIVACILGIKSL